MALDFGDALPLKDFNSHKHGGRNIIFGKYEMGSLLGEGTFSKVYKGKNLMTRETVAIKVLHKEQVEKGGLTDQIKREISVMHLVKHPNIVELKEVMATKAKVFFVMEYVRGGELFAKVKEGQLQEHVARKYFKQLMSAVDFCHSRGVSHRDLKPENLLLDENLDLKVSDFGFSALPEQSFNDGLLHTQCGTPAYVAPEILRRKGYVGAKADIWSCGVILFAMLAGYLPFANSNLMKLYVKIFEAEYDLPSWISSDAKRLISSLLVVDPDKRLTIPQIMKHPWSQKGLTKVITFSNDHLENGDDLQMGAANCKNGDEILESKHSPPSYNAFDFISSMSAGFDLSGLFESEQKIGSRFTSKHRAAVVLTELESVAKDLNFRVAVNENEFKVKLQRKVKGRNGRLSMTAEVFEVAPEVTVVEFSHNSGDTLEHSKFWEEDLKPALKDIVWTWQGDNLPVAVSN